MLPSKRFTSLDAPRYLMRTLWKAYARGSKARTACDRYHDSRSGNGKIGDVELLSGVLET